MPCTRWAAVMPGMWRSLCPDESVSGLDRIDGQYVFIKFADVLLRMPGHHSLYDVVGFESVRQAMDSFGEDGVCKMGHDYLPG